MAMTEDDVRRIFNELIAEACKNRLMPTAVQTCAKGCQAYTVCTRLDCPMIVEDR